MVTVLSGTIYDEQVTLEKESIRLGVERYRELVNEAVQRGQGANLKPAERLLLYWLKPLITDIRKEQRDVRAGKPGMGRAVYGLHILAVDAERIAVIVLNTAISLCMEEPIPGVKAVMLSGAIGRAVMGEAALDKFRSKNHRAKFIQMVRQEKQIHARIVNRWARKLLTDEQDVIWNRRVQMHLGMALMWLLCGIAGVGEDGKPFEPAFHHKRLGCGKKRNAYFFLDWKAFRIIDDGHAIRQMLQPRYMPMVCPPGKWEKYRSGGYITLKQPFVVKASPDQKKAMDSVDLSGMMSAVNDLSSTPWRINSPVLNVVKRVWDSGGNILGIPRHEPIPLPPTPANIDTNEEAKKAWKQEAAKIYTKNKHEQGERFAFAAYKLPQAEKFACRNAIYFPHRLDFRGRAYPIPANLNHQADDVSRGLLTFAEKKPLGERGLRWLKIHAANCYGHDNLPYRERLAWIEANMQYVRQSIDNPLAFEFWQQAENPWQFLAACYDLANATPATLSSIPVQLDGTCNALQHYAALCRDEHDGKIVGLLASPRPGDAYTLIAQTAIPVVQRDALAGDIRAMLIESEINRELVKQPVMTTVYGVTENGARKQMIDKLKKRGFATDSEVYMAVQYLTRIVMASMREAFARTSKMMEWLTECAQAIAKSGRPVQWVTPLGLPVVQPYRRLRSRQIFTMLQKVLVAVDNGEDPVSVSRQRRGFPPNFIHSLDAAHMFMTARAMRSQGLSFASVHDSFWTHAADTDILNTVLRSTFVELHNQPIIRNLYDNFRANYPDIEFREPPAPGNLDLNEVLQSNYFFK